MSGWKPEDGLLSNFLHRRGPVREDRCAGAFASPTGSIEIPVPVVAGGIEGGWRDATPEDGIVRFVSDGLHHPSAAAAQAADGLWNLIKWLL